MQLKSLGYLELDKNTAVPLIKKKVPRCVVEKALIFTHENECIRIRLTRLIWIFCLYLLWQFMKMVQTLVNSFASSSSLAMML